MKELCPPPKLKQVASRETLSGVHPCAQALGAAAMSDTIAPGAPEFDKTTEITPPNSIMAGVRRFIRENPGEYREILDEAAAKCNDELAAEWGWSRPY